MEYENHQAIFTLTTEDFSPYIVQTIARDTNVSEDQVLADPELKKMHDELIQHALSTFTIPHWSSYVREFSDSTFTLMQRNRNKDSA